MLQKAAVFFFHWPFCHKTGQYIYSLGRSVSLFNEGAICFCLICMWLKMERGRHYETYKKSFICIRKKIWHSIWETGMLQISNIWRIFWPSTFFQQKFWGQSLRYYKTSISVFLKSFFLLQVYFKVLWPKKKDYKYFRIKAKLF